MESVVRHYGDHQAFMGSVLVTKHNRPIFESSYGYANVKQQVANDRETRFRIASISKQFTSVAVLLLEERGLVDIDNPVSDYLPDTPPAWARLTTRQLMNHTSGVPNYEGFEEYKSLLAGDYSPERLLALVKARELDFEPGAEYSYSNSGYFLLALVIEHASSRTYSEFLQENLFDPLGLADTGADAGSRSSAPFALGYKWVTNLQLAPHLDVSMFLGAGSLYSTTHDLARWTWALHHGEVLSDESYKKLTTPGLNDSGLGVFIEETAGRVEISHNGSIDGFNTVLAYYPATEVVVVALSNLNDTGVREIGADLAAMAHGKRAETRRGLKSVVWLNRNGEELDLPRPPDGVYESLALTPDGGRLVLNSWRQGDNWDLQVWDARDGTMASLTTNPGYDGFPVWSPDGSKVAFASGQPRQVYRINAAGEGEAELLTPGTRSPKFVLDWSKDNRYLLYREPGGGGGWDLMALPLEGNPSPIPILRSDLSTGRGALSPDGRHIAFTADNSGRIELYLQPFPGNGGMDPAAQLITPNGGYYVRWRADGEELYYLRPDHTMMVVEIESSSEEIRAKTPRALFVAGSSRGSFDVTADGSRFAVIVAPR